MRPRLAPVLHCGVMKDRFGALWHTLTESILRNGRYVEESRLRAVFAQQFDGLPLALRSLLEKTARSAYKVTDEDLAQVAALTKTEDETFELLVCTAVGAADQSLRVALAALDAAGPDPHRSR